jgi:hypothetical protein
MTVLLRIGQRELIHDHCKGRRFQDCVPEHQRVRLQFDDGYEVDVDWSTAGPELREARQHLILTNERAMPSQFGYVRGKEVKHVVTDGERLYLAFTDGHELVIRWERDPDVRAINCTVVMPSVSLSGKAWG